MQPLTMCICFKCYRNFATAEALRQHRITHLSRDVECYGCDNSFKRYCDMISHLEQGICPSGIDHEDINKSAAMVYQWKHLMDQSLRNAMLSRSANYSRGFQHEGKPWKCPSCGSWFKKLSSLFQHAWNSDCEDHYVLGKLQRWLWNRHA